MKNKEMNQYLKGYKSGFEIGFEQAILQERKKVDEFDKLIEFIEKWNQMVI